ncbi:MAG: hypothetical protein J0G28_14470 [Afipia sp.]|nr:hypothetical protein [Afipia sp.]OJW65504.1 MAG: hypothetical protein BGO65_12315 [Afipia sp. 64-13]
MMTLLEHAQSGDLAGLTERLDLLARRIIDEKGRGGSVSDQLIVEAHYYATRGDLDEATLRLRLRARPKWRSEQECAHAYAEAMREAAEAR